MNAQTFTQEKECPVCLKKFSIVRVKSNAYSVSKRDSDFFVHYQGTNPLPYSVWVCPHCHYAATEKDFGKYLSNDLRQKLLLGLKHLIKEPVELEGERDFAKGLRAFELAILTGQVIKAPSGYLAPLFLRASWLARLINNNEKQLTYLEQARILYTDFYMNGNLERMKMSEQGTLYLIAELHRKLGMYEEAVSWFAKVVAIQGGQPEIERLARDQWGLARQQAKGEAPPDDLFDNDEAETDDNDQASDSSAANDGFKTRTKHKAFIAFYQNQLDWLKEISSAQRGLGNNMDIDKLVRIFIDTLMETNVDLSHSKSEAEIKAAIRTSLK